MKRGIAFIIFLTAVFLAACSAQQEQDILELNLKEHKSITLHIHPNVEIEILGEQYPIPVNIGISSTGMRVIHTHEPDGNLHVESPYPHQFYLQDFFTIWGKTFSEQCIFEYCANDTHELAMYVDGEQNTMYQSLPLQDKQKIKIAYKER